jgi:hypothetical protein
MLVFQTPHPLGQLAKRFLVSVFSGAYHLQSRPVHRRRNTLSQRKKRF